VLFIAEDTDILNFLPRKKREETFRRATEEDPSLQDGQKQYMSCDQKESLQSYKPFHEYDRVYE